MTFLSRSRVSKLFSLVALVALAGAFAFYSIAATSGKRTAHAAGVTAISFKGTVGSIKTAHVIDLTALSPTKVVKPSDDAHFGSYHGRPQSGVSTASVQTPRAASAPRSVGNLLHNFDGVSFVQSYTATGGLFGEPPDEGLGVGNGYVFNIVNRAGTIYTKNGVVARGPFSVNAFFGESPTALLSDPRTYYDKATNTWFATVLGYTTDTVGNFTSSHVDVAVNTSGSPLGTWHIYTIDTTDAGGTNPVNNAGCPCLADYPIFGIDQYNVYLSTNEFTSTGAGFNGAQVYVISKSQLAAGTKPLNFVHFGGLSLAGVIAYHLQPATSYGNPNAEYFMNSLDPNGTFDNRIGVWAMTNRQVVSAGGVPNFTATVISSEAYGLPVPAQTPVGYNGRYNQPTTGKLNPDDDAMQEVQYINGHLLAALDTSITIPGDTGARDGLAWFEVQPRLAGAVISSSTKIVDQGYLSAQGLYLLYPHIDQSFDGTTAITFSFTGPTTYPSAAYSVRRVGQRNFTSVQVAAAGVASDNGYTCTPKRGGICRWGDYSAGQLDPSSNNIWFATQYIPGTGNFAANWGNRIFEVKA